MLKENLDSKIESFDGNGENSNNAQTVHRWEQDTNPAISAEEMSDIFKRLNQYEEKADHVYYRWTRSTYRATVDRYIGRQSTDYRSIVDR